MKSQKEINVIVVLDHKYFHKISHSIINDSIVNDTSKRDTCLPQQNLVKESGLPMPLFGTILTRYEYDRFIKNKNNEIEFEDFLELLIQSSELNKKTIVVRSSFLEMSTINDLKNLKLLFNTKHGFDIKFTIVLDDLIDLLICRFLSSMYQIPSQFRHSDVNSFYKNIFKPSIEKCTNRIKQILEIFGENNLNFIYQDKRALKKAEKDSEFELSKLIGINESMLKFETKEEHEINLLFIDYLRCSALDKKVDIREEIRNIKDLSKKYKIHDKPSFKNLDLSNLEEINKLSLEMQSISKMPIIKKILVIKNEICALTRAIRYIKCESLN